MNKSYQRINWENYPSDATPLNESNLNKIDAATNEIDNRVISLDTTKFDKITGATMVKDVSYNQSNGIFTVKYLNGATYNLDTKLEKLAVNFAYDYQTQQLIITLDDGTKQYVNLSTLITQYEFLDTDTVDFVIDSSGKVSAIIKEGSIQEKHLRPDYLADITVESAKAQASQIAAASSAVNAKVSEDNTKSSELSAVASAASAAASSETATNKSREAAVSANEAEISSISAASSAESSEKASATATTILEDVTEKLESGHFNGAAGIQGPQGKPGEQGLTGLQGPTGATGETGPQGIQGIKGDTGSAGKDGDKGDSGPPGPAGAQGTSGMTGASGAQGVPGVKGDTGATGPKGDKGDTGDTGGQGPQGAQGIQGVKGDKGDKGDRGDSGITVPVSGFFTLSVDSNGNLYACSGDGGTVPEFHYEVSSGNLYFVTEV